MTFYIRMLLSMFLVQPLWAQSVDQYAAIRQERRLKAVKIQEPITIDGVLNEAVWQIAPIASDFIQQEPREGALATYRTEVRILYDSENLYLGVIAEDPEARRAVINDLKKDYSVRDNDGFGFILDTFYDLRNAFEFSTNPGGARWDSQMTNESERNQNWDGVWHVKTQVGDDRWVAEVALPFKTLRFSNEPVQTWGINFWRGVRRLNEDNYWAPIPRPYRMNRVSLAGTLEGLEGIQPGANIRLKPYVVANLGQARDATTGVTGSTREFDGGFDLKYGFGAGVTLDATYNTDFSQVEADEQQVNLSRFSLFFPEKRDFFLENSGIFAFGSLGEITPRPSGGGGSGRQSSGGDDLIFFFSRRIGLNEDGRQIPILAGARLTGRTGPWSFGFLNIDTRKAGETQATNFTVARVRRNVLASSQIGAMVINKDERPSARYNRG